MGNNFADLNCLSLYPQKDPVNGKKLEGEKFSINAKKMEYVPGPNRPTKPFHGVWGVGVRGGKGKLYEKEDKYLQ